MKKNILIFDSGKEWGGGSNSLLYLLDFADKEKFNFHVVFFYNYSNESTDIKNRIEKTGAHFYLLHHKKNKFSKLLKEITRLIFFFSKGVTAEILFLIEYIFEKKKVVKEILKIINSKDIHLVYGNNQISSNIEAILSAKIYGISYIQHLRIHAPIKYIEKYLIQDEIALMIANSDGISSYFMSQKIQSPIIVLHNAIDTSIKVKDINKTNINFLKDTDSPVIIMVGSLTRRKRYDVFLNALSLLQQNFVALIVGDGGERYNLEQLSKQLEIHDKTHFLGFRNDVLELISLSDVLVLSSDREPFGRVFLEAMLCKKPIVASDNLQCSQVVVHGYNGYLAKYADSKDFAQKITDVITDENKSISMGESGYALLKQKFDTRSYINELSNILLDYSN